MSDSAAAVAEWVWNAESLAARVARAALTPASALFGAVVAQRNRGFDAATGSSKRGRVRPTAMPALSVGNLTVGGTGKTPVAAWCVRQLRKAGAQPAIVMRGYGDDEWRVHTLLNPGVPVIVAPDRLDGIVMARTRGANCAVMDDAFQHRRAARVADVVLVSADQWTGRARMLPAGPYREPLSALRRATVAVITVKAASPDRVDELLAAIAAAAPDVPVAVMRLVFGTLHLAVTLPATGGSAVKGAPQPDTTGMLQRATAWLAGRNIVAVSAIGNPAAFEQQLSQAGALVEPMQFRDHHAFSAADAESIARQAATADAVVCTLKDAVKLGPLWPRVAPPLWYVSQSVVVERGAPALDRAIGRVLAARVAIAPTAG